MPSFSQPAISGNLFAHQFITDGIVVDEAFQGISSEHLEETERELRSIFAAFPTDQTPNETQTEDDLIWKVLTVLGWGDHLRQQNMSPSGRDDVPDGLLFLAPAAKAKANEVAECPLSGFLGLWTV